MTVVHILHSHNGNSPKPFDIRKRWWRSTLLHLETKTVVNLWLKRWFAYQNCCWLISCLSGDQIIDRLFQHSFVSQLFRATHIQNQLVKLRLWGLFKSKNRHHKAPRGEEDGEIEKKRQISTGKCVSFKVPCFICSTRTNKAALMHHRDTGGRGTGGNRERERDETEGWTNEEGMDEGERHW